MTTADKMNFVGIALTCLGSTVAMVGVYLQMNGYFAAKPLDILFQFSAVVWKCLSKGTAAAQNQLEIDARLGRAKGESLGTSLLGFYLVLFGFLFQMLGSGLLVWALFANGGSGAGHPTG